MTEERAEQALAEPAAPEHPEPAGARTDRDMVAEAATPSAVVDGGGGSRRVLAAVFWLLASLAVLAGGMTLWAHQTLLSANGWGGLVAEVVADEEVTDAVSVVVVDRLAESTGVGEIVAEFLPGPDILAASVTAVAQQRVTEAVARFASSDAFQDAFVAVNKAAHDATMRVIRGGDSEALRSTAGVISLNVFPVVEGLLYGLQDAGIIDASREIPNLSDYQASPRAIALIETLLGRDIPDDVGTIVLVESENLGLVQTVVRWFDLITIVLLLLWAGCTVLALWLSDRRSRMVLWLSVGAIAALLAGRFVTRVILEAVMRRQPELEARLLVNAIVDAAVESLMWFTFVLMVVAVIAAAASIIRERRQLAQRESLETPPRTLAHWVRDNAMLVLVGGIGIILVAALWSVGGAGIALLAGGAILLLVVAVKILADDAEDEAADSLV